jgi:hypothetical protein
MNNVSRSMQTIEFVELETRFGKENAVAILRTLEQFEGVREERVARLSHEDRLRNVFCVMKDNMRCQTRH